VFMFQVFIGVLLDPPADGLSTVLLLASGEQATPPEVVSGPGEWTIACDPYSQFPILTPLAFSSELRTRPCFLTLRMTA
jgi:hypothetical protein